MRNGLPNCSSFDILSFIQNAIFFLSQGAKIIVRLISKAEHLIPDEKRKYTPLLVRATAGLRLLPKEKAMTLIDHVSTAISR